MKYFTKEWYKLMQGMHYTLCMRSIADKKSNDSLETDENIGMQCLYPVSNKNYTDAEIEALYKRKLAAEIKRDRVAYDEPLSMIEIDFDEFSIDDFAELVDGKLVKPKSMDEVKRSYEEQFLQAQREFDARPPFDTAETVKMFEQMYAGGLKHGYDNFPDWVKDEVDIRLIALGYLPKSVFDRLKAEQKRNRTEFNKIERAARKELGKQAEKIPSHISQHFCFHDGQILAFQNIGDDIIMTIKVDCIPFDDETPYARITFVDGKIVLRDDNLKFEHRKVKYDEAEYDSYCTWLYEELYKTDNGYEAHMLLSEDGLGYLTISCRDIKIQLNIDYDEQ